MSAHDSLNQIIATNFSARVIKPCILQLVWLAQKKKCVKQQVFAQNSCMFQHEKDSL